MPLLVLYVAWPADDECNHHLFEHNQPGLSNVMSGPLFAVSSSFYARAHAAAGAVCSMTK